MTVTYSSKVANATFFGFHRLLLKWRGSIYKLLYREFIVFAVLYTAISLVYRVLCDFGSEPMVEPVCESALARQADVPHLQQRPRKRPARAPAPEDADALRQPHVPAHLPLGFMTADERKVFDHLKSPHLKYWVPFIWFGNLAAKARNEGRIRDSVDLQSLMTEMNRFRSWCSLLFGYDWVGIPLVYTQVVTLAVYTFFFACLIGRQFLDPSKGYAGHDLDLYIPIFTLLQFFFYAGWLKVAEQLINPFGEDDDDFETNWCIDRNLQVSLLAVDEMHMSLPKMKKDIYWDDSAARPPYTLAAADYCIPSFLGSTIQMGLSESHFPGEEWLWDFEKHGHRRSVIRRVKRFLSTHEHPSSPKRRSYRRQASDSSMFLPPSPARDLLDVPPRSSPRASAPQKPSHSPEGSPPTLHSSVGELPTIRETSQTSTLPSLTPQSSVRASPTKMPQVPEVLITAAEAPVPPAEGDPHDSTTSILSLEFTGVQPSRTGQQEDPGGRIQPPSDLRPQAAERNTLKLEQDPDGAKILKRWSLPEFRERSHTSPGNRSPQPENLQPPLLLDTELSSEIRGANTGTGSWVSPDMRYLMENLDTQETDIIEFNDEQAEESARAVPQSSRTWF
ncbi:bestrophin-3 isoform X2 [Oryctolagus cuniculus]|uniref:bestrophin-3 isoform X2 n=2 Tax=Oryctolagus cuniculus TaxID=9986 RepID=UPI00048F37D4|nr:bestrophin-3 isoform X2 [Oryctolagus cuniculus]